MNDFGVNVWWTIPSAVIDQEVALVALEKAGFGPDIGAPSLRKAVSRAANSFANRRTKTDRKLVETVADNARFLKYGILEGSVDTEVEEASYSQTATVTVDKVSDVVTVDGTEQFRQVFFDRLGVYKTSVTGDDLREFLTNLIDSCKGVPKRPSGGIYFVPGPFMSLIESASEFFTSLNIGARIYMEGVVNGERERQILWETVEGEIGKQIDEHLKAVEKIGKRVTCVKTHEAKIGELQGLRDVYVSLLGEEARYEEISKRLADAVGEVGKKIAELSEDPESDPGIPAKVPAKVKSNPAKPRGSKVVEVAVQVLEEAGCALHFKDITRRAISVGLYETTAENPAESVNSGITKAILAGEERIVRVGRGVFALKA